MYEFIAAHRHIIEGRAALDRASHNARKQDNKNSADAEKLVGQMVLATQNPGYVRAADIYHTAIEDLQIERQRAGFIALAGAIASGTGGIITAAAASDLGFKAAALEFSFGPAVLLIAAFAGFSVWARRMANFHAQQYDTAGTARRDAPRSQRVTDRAIDVLGRYQRRPDDFKTPYGAAFTQAAPVVIRRLATGMKIRAERLNKG